MHDITIGEVARQTGLRTSTIRYYESLHLLSPLYRVSGQRRYEISVIERIAFIQSAQKLGFSLTEIQELLSTPTGCIPLSERWQALAQQKLREIDQLILHAQDIKHRLGQGLNCACSDLENCIECVTQIFPWNDK
jgi:MerR family transcriptional regulator, redox-sensitive transcriptional activator SoxR